MTDQLKQRDGDQPLPTTNDHPDIQSMVIADIVTRREVGISRYGTALQPFNGRDALRDLYEELLDGAMYVRQAMVERDAEVAAALARPRQRLLDLVAELDRHLAALDRTGHELTAKEFRIRREAYAAAAEMI